MAYSWHKDFDSSLNGEHILRKLISLSSAYEYFALYITEEDRFSFYAGTRRTITLRETSGAFEALEKFQSASDREICGFLGYDLKNDLEKLSSENPDCLEAPEASFFEAELKLEYREGKLSFSAINNFRGEELLSFFEAAQPVKSHSVKVKPEAHTSEAEYLAAAHSLKAHLQRGDIYEANYCIQFSAHSPDFDPYSCFYALWQNTRAPFSVFSRLGDFFVLSGSPERYLKREGRSLISQPIKGTAKRSTDLVLDHKAKTDLQLDPKEQSENVMIVDLVRNDLSRVAARGSVKVSELFGLHSFKTVHHLISTVEAQVKDGLSSWDALRASFPMGSMTGAPKISAMKLIEEHENFKRSAYSGAFGLIHPSGDFDFNVLIRTLFFQKPTQKLAFSVGSAITIQADPVKEYSECLLKAEALMRSLGKSQNEPSEIQ